MNNINVFKERQLKDAKLAGEVMAFATHAQFDENGFIKDDTARYESILAAAKASPMFEGCPEEFTGAVANAWASGMADYANKNGRYPSAELLADAHRSLSRLLLEAAPDKKHVGWAAPMFESAQQAFMEAAGDSMTTSPGIMRLALFAALILPVALGATTADAVTFVPCERDESDIYRVYQIAASNFGSYTKGDVLDMQSAGVFAHFHRHAVFAANQQPDGTKATFSFTTKETETGGSVAAGTNRLGKDIPIRPGRVRVLIDRMPTKVFDDANGSLGINITNAQGVNYDGSAKIDYQKGTIDVTLSKTAAKGVEIAATFELDVEAMPEIIPLVNQKMTKWTVKPSQYALATEYTVQALMDAQREFGLDLSSQLFNGARNWLSHETDVKRLREMLFHCVYGYQVNVAYPHVKQLDAYLMHLKQQISNLSTAMVNRTLTSGIRGGFAGYQVANFLKSLPSSVWTPAPGYQESPYIQFCGTLFGSIRIYEVPNACSVAMGKENCNLNGDQCLFYGRGDNIGDAGLIAGDAVPAIPFVHPTTTALVNRTTLWGSAINTVHPDHGEDYFCMVTFWSDKAGEIFNPVGDSGGPELDDASGAIVTP
ncbi:capsid protein [Citrobacter portucalensis]|uniref:capsid protein n=1 Tax=Citrobacter portucalensis TaxID=1639133 RepID=UPI00226B9878|nr:capsid protein [Citrobacter portucalensis]MCX8980184.1 capsid protein [Citrobacter portucalensis]